VSRKSLAESESDSDDPLEVYSDVDDGEAQDEERGEGDSLEENDSSENELISDSEGQ